MTDQLDSDLRALAHATERVPSLAHTQRALDAELARRTPMSKLFRRPYVALAILLIILLATPVVYALATDRFHFFVDTDDSSAAIDTSVKQQARDQAAHGDVTGSKDDDGVHVKLAWHSLKDMFADCLGSDGDVKDVEAEVAQGGQTTTQAIDRDKHRKLMAILVEADRLHEQLESQDVPPAQCAQQMLDLVRTRLTALGVALPAPASSSHRDQVIALEQGIKAWLAAGTPFEFHVGP